MIMVIDRMTEGIHVRRNKKKGKTKKDVERCFEGLGREYAGGCVN